MSARILHGPASVAIGDFGHDPEFEPTWNDLGYTVEGVEFERMAREAVDEAVQRRVVRASVRVRLSPLTVERIAKAFGVPVDVLDGWRRVRERWQVEAMRARARRRGRKKGRA